MAISFDGIVTPEKYFPQQSKTVVAGVDKTSDGTGVQTTVGSSGIKQTTAGSNSNTVSTGIGEQPINDGNCPRFATYGLALGESPISLSGTIVEHFNSFMNPPLVYSQTDGMHREEAARRLSLSGNTYVFVNTGKKIGRCDVVGAAQSLLTIPTTNTIQFIAFYIAKYSGYYYVGEDGSLFTLEIKRNEMPPAPNDGTLGSGKWLYPFGDGDIVRNEDIKQTYGMWSGNVGNLRTFFTSSIQNSGSKRFHIEIFNKTNSDCSKELQFSLAYGNSNGSGSYDFGGADGLTATKAVYGQYRSLCLEPSQSLFRIGSSTIKSMYFINIKRARMGDRLDEGNIELNLHHLSGSQWLAGGKPRNAFTGSNIRLGAAGRITRLIDDSIINEAVTTSAGDVYNLVSGSIENGVYTPTSPVIYGKVYPQLGIVALNGNKLDASVGFCTVTGSEVSASNYMQLYRSISGSARYTDLSGDYLGFQARKVKKIHSTYYYVRAKNEAFNFSNNPTYVTGSEGEIISDFQNNPSVYITTVGLYNKRRELLGVGKISQPILKNYTEEAMVRVNLKYE